MTATNKSSGSLGPGGDTIRAIEAVEPEHLADWLAQGFMNRIRCATPDPFAPHSFVSLFPSAVEAIAYLYPVVTPRTQRALHTGIRLLGIRTRESCPESVDLSDDQRTDLLQDFLSLCRSTLCYSAADTICDIASEVDSCSWPNPQTIFLSCLDVLEDIALKFNSSAHAAARPNAREIVESRLKMVMQQRRFQPRYAPKLLAALVWLNEKKLFEHLAMLGGHVAEYHRVDETAELKAKFTAACVVEKAYDTLVSKFEQLQIDSADARDFWLIDALLGKDGPMRYLRPLGDDHHVVCQAKSPELARHVYSPSLSRLRMTGHGQLLMFETSIQSYSRPENLIEISSYRTGSRRVQ